MPNYQRKEIVPGLFVLAAVAVFALFAFRIGRWQVLDFLKGDRLACHAVFGEIKSLAVGAKVVVAGRRVGAVNRLSWTDRPYAPADIETLRRQLGDLPPDIRAGSRRLAVEVDFELSDASLRLDPASAQVSIQQDGLLGQHYIDLYPGFWQEGREPPPILAAGYAQPLRVQTQQAGGSELLTKVGDALTSMDTLIKTLNDQVFSPANCDNLTTTLASVRNAADELRRLLDAANATVASVHDTTLPRADQLLDEARGGARDFRAALADVQKDLGAVLDQLQGTLLDNRPELAESVRRLRSTLWQAEMAVRQIRANPSVLLFGGNAPDLEARDLDESGTRATGRARIYQQRDERAGGK
jgi:ABC-type transporter Mla subunit MlaD